MKYLFTTNEKNLTFEASSCERLITRNVVKASGGGNNNNNHHNVITLDHIMSIFCEIFFV